MSRIQQYQSNFSLGEIDPLLRGRIDLQQYYSALETAQNVLIEPQGGFSRRGGLKFLQDLSTFNVHLGFKLIPFEFSSTQTFLILLTPHTFDSSNPPSNSNYIRVYVFKNGVKLNLGSAGYITHIPHDYYGNHTTQKVDDLYYAQSADTIILTSESIPPFEIRRGGSDTIWTATQLDIVHAKSQLTKSVYNPSGTITPDAEDGAVTITASSGIFHTGTEGMSVVVSGETIQGQRLQDGSIAGQVTLSTNMSSVNGIYVGSFITFYGVNEIFHAEYLITGYTGSSKVATISYTGVVGTHAVGNNYPRFYTIESLVGQFIQVENGFGRARIIDVDSTTVCKVNTVTPFFKKDVAIANGDYNIEVGFENAVSRRRGYYKTVQFHEGRLYFAGTASEPNTLFGSKVGQFLNFKQDEGLDDDAIKVTLATERLNAITALKSGRDLQIFTTGGEFYLPQRDLEPVTPSNVSVKLATRRGSKPNIRPQGAEGGTLFIQRSGKALREMLYSDVELSYVANNISLLSSHLIVDPQKMVLRPATDTTEGDLLMIVNGTNTSGYRSVSQKYAGTIACFMMNKGQNIVAPSYFTTTGIFKEIEIDNNNIYAIVERNANYYMQAVIDYVDNDYGVPQYNNPDNTAHLTNFRFVLTESDGTSWTFRGGTVAQQQANPHPFNTYYFHRSAYGQEDGSANILKTVIASTGAFTCSNVSNDQFTITRVKKGTFNLSISNEFPPQQFTLSSAFSSATQKITLEVFDKNFTTDGGYQNTSSMTGTIFSGLPSHMIGSEVSVIRDDIVDPLSTATEASDGSAQITTLATPNVYLEAGLNFDVEVKTMPFETKLASGSVQSQKRRIVEISPMLFKTQNIEINGFDIPLDTFPISSLGGVPTFTGIKKTMGFRGYTRDAQITIKQTQPVFLTVLSLDFKVSVGQ
tara:strand:+ start:1073 stop:3838 length:2766 start_codon:yes stop_codon:yes gene_type:complete